MKEKINILFLGGAKRVSLAEHFIDAGRRMGREVGIYSYELSLEVPLAIVGEVIVGKHWADPGLYEDLDQVITRHDINIVLPFIDPAIEVAGRLKEMRPDVFIPVSSIDICRRMFDKRLANEWFLSHDIPVPGFYDRVDRSHYPLILKPRLGSASRGIMVLDNENHISRDGINPEDYLIQDYIAANREYTVDCYVARDGGIISIVPRIRLETSGGEAVSSRTTGDEEMDVLSRQILAAGAFSGPVTIQFIRDCVKGKVYVMEINPRLGGGVLTSIAAGADVTAFILDEACGEKLTPVVNWKKDTLMTRYFKEVIFYADNH